MKITDIKITPKLGAANRDWVLLKIETDEAIDGLGEDVLPPLPARQFSPACARFR